MHRSSTSIGGLAAALAKAQAELVNPEKSLVGSIYSNTPDGGERIFRYAPLSAGLDIVRKTLGQHDIAVVQTTAIDQAAAIVNLTTVLAHASGEWISSDWPVCAVSATATPHRMGAALSTPAVMPSSRLLALPERMTLMRQTSRRQRTRCRRPASQVGRPGGG
jgi:hypothetical protein